MKSAESATVEDGRMDALEIAVATIAQLMSTDDRAAFCALLRKNISTFEDVTIGLPLSEAWREGLAMQSAKLLLPLERSLPKKGPGGT